MDPTIAKPLRRWASVAFALALGGRASLAAEAPPVPNPAPGAAQAVRPPAPAAPATSAPVPGPSSGSSIPESPPTLLDPRSQPIDLNTTLRLAGVQNPDLLLARQRVVEAAALRQLAAAQILPTINLGTNYDSHTGVLQQSNGNILTVNRSALYVGAGANAVAAGTVNIPGVVLSGNIAEGVYAFLGARQVVREREFASLAVRNQVFLRAASAYSELIRAEGRRAIAVQTRDESKEVARLTADYASQGLGRQADADRAATELAQREANVQQAEGEVLTTSARLAAVLNLDPSIRLHPTDAFAVPMPIIPDPTPLAELVAVALLRRPELGERRAVIREALLALEGSKVLPFSPTVLVGFSSGGFGGGSNLVKPVFGGFGYRSDFDTVAYWSIRNMGVGNLALIRVADANLKSTRFQEIGVLNLVRSEVAEAYAKTHARFAQIGTTEMAVRSGLNAFREDYDRIKLRAQRDVLPIELLDSLRLLARSRAAYLDAIVDFNIAEFELFVAMGQPPADALARPVPAEGIAPSNIPGPVSPPPAGPNPAAPAPFAAPGGNTLGGTPARSGEVRRASMATIRR